MEQAPILNEHNKQEYPPMHTGRRNISFTKKNMANKHRLIIVLFFVCIVGCYSPWKENLDKEQAVGILNADSMSDITINDSTFLCDTIDGWLTPYIHINLVINNWGYPDSVSEAVMMGYDGLLHQSWFYKKKNVIIDVSGDSINVSKNKNALTVESIAITGPSDCRMSHSIRIDDSREKIERMWHGFVNEEYSDNEHLFIGFQMPYWGIVYTFKNKKLVEMYNGTLAE